MNKFSIGIMALAVALIVVGCGGSSPSKATAPASRTKTVLANGHRHILSSSGMAGIQMQGLSTEVNGPSGFGGGVGAGGGPGGGGPAGGGGFSGGLPMFGGFLRHTVANSGMGHGMGRLARKSRDVVIGHEGGPDGGPDGGGGNGGPGGGDFGPDYDGWLGLYTTYVATETSFTTNLFLDAAKTQPAGSFFVSFPIDTSTFPLIYASTYSITGGQFAGSHGVYKMTMNSETDGAMTYDNVWTGGGTSTGFSSWSAASSSWNNKSTFADGSWFQDQGTYSADGTGSSVTSNSLGYKYTYAFKADGSGSGRIEGPDAGLPATIVWTPKGVVTITYADGTSETFNPWANGDAVCNSVTDAGPQAVSDRRKR